jgi:hypothetical protein
MQSCQESTIQISRDIKMHFMLNECHSYAKSRNYNSLPLYVLNRDLQKRIHDHMKLRKIFLWYFNDTQMETVLRYFSP